MKITAIVLSVLAILGAATIAVQANLPLKKVQLYTYITLVTDVSGVSIMVEGYPPVTLSIGANQLHYAVDGPSPMVWCNGQIFTCYDDDCKTPPKSVCPVDIKIWRVQPEGWSPIGYKWPDEDL